MKKISTILTLIILASFCAFAQKKLEVDDITPNLSVYPCGDRAEAQVVIRCSEGFELMFDSNVDNNIGQSKSVEGSEKIYYLVFPTKTEGTTYKGRILSIIAPGFDRYSIPLNLRSKDKKEFRVRDPYSPLRSTYYISLEEGIRMMENGGFAEARDKFKIAQGCPEYKTGVNDIDKYIENCDSALVWNGKMRQYERTGQYGLAVTYAKKIYFTIPNCKYIEDECVTLTNRFNEMCKYNKTTAAQYIKAGKLEEARNLLQQTLSGGGQYDIEAQEMLNTIDNLEYAITNKVRTFSYQYAIGRPIGFMTARLKPKGVGIYFTMGLNKECLDLISNQLDPVQTPQKLSCEIGASFGLTIPVVPKYGWLLVSPLGYIGGGYLLKETAERNPDSKALSNVTWIHGYTPELGLEGKIWRIVIGYRIQYRYCISKSENAQDVLGKLGHIFTLGFCW